MGDPGGFLVDVIVVVILVLAAFAGLRRGLVASIGGLVGFAAGAVAAYALAPVLASLWPWPQWRSLVLIVGAIILVGVLTAVGGAIGRFVRRGVDRARLRPVDRVLGGVLSVVVAALAASLVGQSLSMLGMPVVSSAVSSSRVVRVIQDLTPARSPPRSRRCAEP